MEQDRPRWRFRISTLMLLVVIAALVSYIALLQHRERRARLEAEALRVVAEYERAQAAAAQQAKARMPAATGPTE